MNLSRVLALILLAGLSLGASAAPLTPEEAAGKRLHKDAEAGKATFVSLLGLAGAKARAAALVAEAEAALAPYGEKAETLRETARFVISRDR